MSNQPHGDVDEACSRLGEVLLETRGQDRREFLGALGKAAAGSVLLSPFGALSASADAKPMTYFTYGGAWKKAIMAAFGDPFTKKTAIPVRYQEPYNFGKLVAMHQAHAQQIDAVTTSGVEVIIAQRSGMLTPLDWSLIDKSALSDVQLRRPNTVGGESQSMNVTYSTKKWPGDDHPNSWADFWNVEKFRGRRALRRDALWTIEAAVKADGVSEAEFYPLDVDRAFREPRPYQAARQNLVERQLAVPAADGTGRGRSHSHDQRPRYPIHSRSQGASSRWSGMERSPRVTAKAGSCRQAAPIRSAG